jgi:hypothetical protein
MFKNKKGNYTNNILREIKFAFLPVKLHDTFLYGSEVSFAKLDKIWLEKYVKYTELGENAIVNGVQTYKKSTLSYKRKVIRYSDAILAELKK